MLNKIAEGKVLTIPAPSGGVVSGTLKVIGSLVGVPVTDAAEDELFAFDTTGVFEVPKTSAQAWTVGAKIYWTAGGEATTTATANTLIGIAVAVAANPSDTGQVKIGPTL